MSDSEKKFIRFQQEHARLQDPALLRGAVELVPVELSSFINPPSYEGTRKKKKKHGAAAAWTKLTAKPLAETSPGERLLPEDFLRRLQPPRDKQASATATTNPSSPDTPRGQPNIEVEPQNIVRSLRLFQEMEFTLDAPAAQQLELIWREQRKDTTSKESNAPDAAERINALAGNTNRVSEWQRVVMAHRRADQFATEVGIPDGAYLFGIIVDGHMRPDPRFSRRLLLNAEGLFTPYTLRRHTQNLQLTNKSKFDERVRLETSAPWLKVDDASIDLSARSSAETTLQLNPVLMQAGLNEALLRIFVERDGHTVDAAVVNCAMHAEVGGAIPTISIEPRELGEIRHGIDQAELQVQVTARGLGQLSGMISLPHSGELTDFCISADNDETSTFTHIFHVDSASLPQPQPYRLDAVLKVMLVTDSFLANYRVSHAEIPYRLVHLKKSLPALSFGTVRAGGSKAMRLEVSRSDRQAVELSVLLPAGVAAYLQAYPARADAYVFRFDTNTLPPGTSISETIELIDLNSGLRDQVKVLATVQAAVS
jgi:hypothetical protein